MDELGGFPMALRLTREAIGLPPEAPIHLKLFPEQHAFWETWLDRLLGDEHESSEPSAAAVLLAQMLRLVRPVLHLAHTLGLTPRPDVLTMPEVRPR